LKSVLPGNFNLPILLILIYLSGCTQAGRRYPEIVERTSAQSILSLRAVKSTGPAIDEGNTLVEPAGVTVNKLGQVFLSDRGTNTIFKLSPALESISGEGGIGRALGDFNRPMGLAADAALNLYVADSGNRRIQVLDRNLRYVNSIDSYFDQDDSPVNFELPEDICIDGESSFWITDNDKVIRLDPFFGLQFEMSYDAPGDFAVGRVSAVDVSQSDLVAVADTGNRRIIVATIYGNLVSRFAVGSVSSLAWDSYGILWAADPEAGKLSAYDSEGNLMFVFAESYPNYRPVRMTFDPSGRLLVADGARRTLTVYEVVRGAGE
jgi:sugar lactone lactonase YvrE